MDLYKLATRFLELTKTARNTSSLADENYELLLKINNTPSHYLAVADMTGDELMLARQLEELRLIQRIPEGHGVTQEREHGTRVISPMKHRSLPDRYVMRASGDHLLGSFDFDTLHEEKRERRRRMRGF